jgi:5-methyltetrahydrofolate--homocysteine methyltransferase
MLIIGERINSSRKSIAEAVSSRDRAFIQGEALAQAKAGAAYIDVNAGAFAGRESECLKWIVDSVQEATDLPLCIDSPDPKVIRGVLPSVRKKPMINSVTLDPDRLDIVLPMVVDSGAKVIGLCQSQRCTAMETGAKLEMAGRLVEAASAAGIPLDDLYIDPLVHPIATDTQSALNTMNAIRQIMEQFPGVHTTCGLSNISFGLPNRKLVNRTFLVGAIGCGLDSVIIDPTDKMLYGALRAGLMTAGKDEYCRGYIKAHRESLMEGGEVLKP